MIVYNHFMGFLCFTSPSAEYLWVLKVGKKSRCSKIPPWTLGHYDGNFSTFLTFFHILENNGLIKKTVVRIIDHENNHYLQP